MNTDRVEQLYSFIKLLNSFKSVDRLSLIKEGGRRESDAEHTWHITMAVWLMTTAYDKPVDVLRCIKMALVHDLVEIYAGDVYGFDASNKRSEKEEKEQSAMIEDKMTKTQIVKEDATIDKYNIDAITGFIKTHMADLGETYKRSTIPQLKAMFSSMFDTGLAWNYKGTLNYMISPLYKSILDLSSFSAPFGAGDETRTRDLLLGKETLYH